MSIHAAYKALMESGAPSKEDVIMQGMCREWIWEFLLKHCTNSGLIRALAVVYPVPDGSLHLKRLLYLKSLSFNLAENQFSDRTLESISALSSLYRAEQCSLLFHVPISTSDGNKSVYQFSLQQLLLAVRVECTVQYLRADVDDWPKFYESLEKYWGDYAEDTQEPEHTNDDEDGDTFLELKEELWAVQKQPELRHDLLKRRKREYMMRMMQSFLSDAWKDAGNCFLEDVAENLKKGLYVPDGFAPCTKEARKSSPGKSNHMSYAKSSHARLSKVSGDKIVGTSIPKSLSKNSCMPSDSISERPNDVSMAKDSSNKVCTHHASSPGRHAETTELVTRPFVRKDGEGPSTSKDLEKGSHLPGRPSLGSVVAASNTMDPRILLGCTEPMPVEQKHTQVESLSGSRRRIPTSLQEGKKTDSNTDVSQAVKKVQMRGTRSLLRAGIGEGDATVVNGSSGSGQEPLNSVLSGIPCLKDTCVTEVRKVRPTEAMERRDQGAHDLEEAELMCPSPPPWAGSPGMNGTVTTRKRPRRASVCLNGAHTSNTVAAVGEIGHIDTPVILKAQSELREGHASLIAAVQDPLPEALKIAEEAAKTSNLVRQAREQTFSVNNKNQGMQSLSKNNNNVVQALEGAVQGPREKPSKKSIMDRNPTAHTVEWETSDDIADSSDDKSPSHSRQIHLPRIRPRQSFALQGGVVARKEPKRRKFQKWTEEETNVLRKEVERYGKGRWKHILQNHQDIFESRTEVDLKDKWRNIERREGIL